MDYTYLMEKYNRIKKSGKRYALIQINIKNFRYFNSRYGSAAGDEILQLVLECVQNTLDEEEYGAHLQGDNFAILIKCEDVDKLVYERMMDLIQKVYRIDDDRIYRNLFISMGIYLIENDSVSLQDALNHANLCRKESSTLFNRSHCMEIYENSIYRAYMDRMVLEEDTAQAYINYEFVTYLQPKVNLKTGAIVGAEALLRWFDKDGNSVPLYKFLPILNENGYIELVDIDTVEHMCKFLKRRIENKQRVVPISVNISKSYFYKDYMIQEYTDVLKKYDIPPGLIEIELMESISLDDKDRMKEVIEGFKKQGFTCSLDDFGNGYSSFGVLLNAKLDIVKLDRQFFVENLNGDSELIIKTVVDLIHSLGMKVVAEGVEDRDHIEFLKEIGCDYVQGYYYYRPMPVDEFEKLLDFQ